MYATHFSNFIMHDTFQNQFSNEKPPSHCYHDCPQSISSISGEELGDVVLLQNSGLQLAMGILLLCYKILVAE